MPTGPRTTGRHRCRGVTSSWPGSRLRGWSATSRTAARCSRNVGCRRRSGRSYGERMSDLQCPARVLVARHGEAMFADPDLLSDEGGWLTDLGKHQADELADRLVAERVAAVYTSRLARAQETGERVGLRLGLTPRTLEGVEEFGVGSLAGTPAMAPAAREVFVAWVMGDLDRRWP